MKSKGYCEITSTTGEKKRGTKKPNLQNMKLKIDQILLVPNEQPRPKFTTCFLLKLQW